MYIKKLLFCALFPIFEQIIDFIFFEQIIDDAVSAFVTWERWNGAGRLYFERYGAPPPTLISLTAPLEPRQGKVTPDRKKDASQYASTYFEPLPRKTGR